MTAIIVIAAVLAFLALLIILPARVRLKYDNDFAVKVYYAFIKVYDSTKQKPPPHEKEKEEEKPEEEKPKKESFIVRDWEKMTKTEFIKYYAAVLKDLFGKLLPFVKKLRFKLLSVTVGVGAPDASDTAVQYGAVCTALDPVFSLLNTYTKIKTRRINIYSDFITGEYTLGADVNVSVCLIYLLVFGFRIYKLYKSVSAGTFKPEEPKENENSKENQDKESVKTNERAKQ